MRTVSVRELKSNPSEALRDAREGPVLVLNRGLPEALVISVAGERHGALLEQDVSDAVAVITGLAERRGVRAVRAVDRATSRRAAEARTTYGVAAAADDLPLATLAATLQAIAAPRRMIRRRARGPGDPETVRLVMDRAPANADRGRIDAAAVSAGRRVIIQLAAEADDLDPDETVVFDREDVPVRAIDRLVAEGRARRAVLQLPFPAPVSGRGETSALDELLRERASDPR